MFSQAFLTEFESLNLQAARALADILANSTRDAARVSAALGILRLSERLMKKLPLPEGGCRGASLPLPVGGGRGEGSCTPPRAETPTSNPEPDSPLPNPNAPLSEPEITELLSYYPHVGEKRVRNPRQAGVWRSYLLQGRYWTAHWAEEERAKSDKPQATTSPERSDGATPTSPLSPDG